VTIEVFWGVTVLLSRGSRRVPEVAEPRGGDGRARYHQLRLAHLHFRDGHAFHILCDSGLYALKLMEFLITHL
jgi:hypothetical protein